MYQLACAVNKNTHKSKYWLFRARCLAFFGNSAFNFEFVGHILYLAGSLTKGLGVFCLDEDYNLKCGFDKRDDLTLYRGFHPVKIGICLQGIAILMVMTKLLQFLRLHSSVRDHPYMTSAKISGFWTPPCPHLGLIYSTKFTQPPLLHLLLG